MISRQAYKARARKKLLKARPLPSPCDRCGRLVKKLGSGKWDGNVHHVDEDFTNDDLTNLSLLHRVCHERTHSESELTKSRRAAASRAMNSAEWLNSSASVEKRTATLQARYDDPGDNIRKHVSAGVIEACKRPEVKARMSAGMRRRWDSTESRERQSSTIKETFGRGGQVKSSCPNGCGLVTYPGPMGRHLKACPTAGER